MPKSPHALRPALEVRCVLAASLIALLVASAVICCVARAGAESASARDQPASPASGSVLLLIRTRDDDGVVAQLRAELAESGWTLREVAASPQGPPPPLGEIAQRWGARAAVRVDEARGEVEVWVDQQEGAVSETLRASGQHPDDRVVALKITEALRARGLEFGNASRRRTELNRAREPHERERSQPVDRSAEVPSRESVSERTLEGLGFALGPGLVLSPGGLGPGVVALASARASLPAALNLSLVGLLPLSSGSASGVEGTARVRPWLLGGVLEWTFRPSPAWDARAGAGLAGTRVSMSGDGSQGFRAVHDHVWAAVPLIMAHVGAPLGSIWRVEFAAWVGATFPEIEVYFGERAAANWGRPLVGGALTLELCPQCFLASEPGRRETGR